MSGNKMERMLVHAVSKACLSTLPCVPGMRPTPLGVETILGLYLLTHFILCLSTQATQLFGV